MIHELPNWRTHDDRGVTMPWYSRPCLEWLDKLDLHHKEVFEFGCGASSLWYLSRRADINGVDSSADWQFIPVGEVVYQWVETDKEAYVTSCHRPRGQYDLIIIDGDFRDDCTEHALKHLKKGGYLIADNFEQPSADLAHWPKTRELTKGLPVTFYKEPGHIDWVSAVFHNI